jgi:cell division topological specificity factor
MMSWLWPFRSRSRQSAALAKQRLQIVISQQRQTRPPRAPDYLPALQRELARVVSKYAKVPSGDVQVQLQRRHDNRQVLEVKVRLPQAAAR